MPSDDRLAWLAPLRNYWRADLGFGKGFFKTIHAPKVRVEVGVAPTATWLTFPLSFDQVSDSFEVEQCFCCYVADPLSLHWEKHSGMSVHCPIHPLFRCPGFVLKFVNIIIKHGLSNICLRKRFRIIFNQYCLKNFAKLFDFVCQVAQFGKF